MKKLSERDQRYLWHPLTQHKTHPGMLGITSAKGVFLHSEEGHSYIDAIASWYTCMYGHCNDFIIDRVQDQMRQLDQVVFSGFTHKPAIELAEALAKILPANQQKFFFSDNGSTAVEVAIKMAIQYHFNKGEKRNIMLALEEGFHGDTFGAMSVSGLSVYNGAFEDFFIKVIRLPRPTEDNIEELLHKAEVLLEENAIAGFIYEPLVQGAAGMKLIEACHLDPLLELMRNYGVLTIADEVMTGFGKTGSNFASDQIKHHPDLMCLSKALTAGLLPMGLTTCTREIFDAFYSEEISKGFFHGHTYTANPLACTAASAALELLLTDEIQTDICRINQMHADFDARMKRHPKVGNSRYTGVIYALDLAVSMQRYGKLRDTLYKKFMHKGVFLRPLGNTIYILPPYIITDDQLSKVYQSIEEVIDSI